MTRKLMLLVVLTMLPVIGRASNITLQGNFAADDSAQFFSVSILAPAAVDIRSLRYAGGTTSTGTTVPRGGFDTILALFSASGVFIEDNDDGAGVPTDPTTGLAADARITANLSAGAYVVALTQYNNFSIGNLADGFAETGNHNFTADPTFANGGSCPGNLFRDISGTEGRCRDGDWAVDFANVASATPVAATPEPSALLLAGFGFVLLLGARLRRRRPSTLLAAGIAAALASVQVQAQSNPDFSKVNDILHGNRTLYKVTDVQIIEDGPETASNLAFYQLPMSNSSPGQSQPPLQVSLLTPSNSVVPALQFSGSIFNLPKAVTVQIARTNLEFDDLLQYSVQNASINPNFNLFTLNNPRTPTNGVVSDFNGDGYDDIALAYDDGSYQILTATDVNTVYVPFAQDPLKAGPSSTLDVLTSLTAGNFDGKGRQQIAGLEVLSDNGGTQFNHLGLVLYAVNPSTLQLQRVFSKPFVLTTPGTTYDNPIIAASIARGQFNVTGHDQLAISFSLQSGSSIVEIVDFSYNSVTNTLTPIEEPQLTIAHAPLPLGYRNGYIQLATGKFNSLGSSYDQIVFHVSSTTSAGDKFFEVLSAGPVDLSLTAHAPITYSQAPCASYNGLQVGNFDHKQANAPTGAHDTNAQIALLYCTGDGTTSTLNIYSVTPATFDVQGTPDSALGLNVYAQNASFVATDIQGRSMVLGEPTKLTINNSSPSVINALPPMHIDYITPVGGIKPEVVNLSYSPSGFNSSFSLTQESKTGGDITSTLSWSAGVDLSTSFDYQIGDPDTGTGERYSAAFDVASHFTGSSDNSTITYQASTFDAGKTAETADVVIYDDSRLNIWVYPVIGQTVCPATNPANPNCSADQQLPLTIQFSGPDMVSSESISADLLSATWYQPPWEWGNVLSYPATQGQLALIYPELLNDPNNQLPLSTGLAFVTDNSSTSILDTWSSSTDQGATSSLANTTSFDVSVSGVGAIGVTDVAGTKLSASLKLSGSVGLSKLQTNNANIQASNGIAITAVAKFLDPGNYGYVVSPFILGNFPPAGVSSPFQVPQANIQTVGPLKTAFTANPIATGAWWQGGPYSSAPDVALNHPSRWNTTHPSVGDKLPLNCRNYGKGASDVDCADIQPFYGDDKKPLNMWNSEYLAMRGLFISRADDPGAGPQLLFATAGEKLNLAARVYNYSLAPVDAGNQVHVRFYAMPWDSANNVQTGDSLLIGETITDPIPPFNVDTTTADLNWRVIRAPTSFDTTPYQGKFFVFWIVVWMENSSGGIVSEIPGHGLTPGLASMPASLSNPYDVPLEMAIAADGVTAVSYSNNVGLYHYAFPVLAPQTGLGATPPEHPADTTLKNVSFSKKFIKPGQVDEITAVLRAGSEGTRNLKVYFYDGDPDANGRLIGIEKAWFQGRSTAKVSIPFHAPSDGVHRIWAVINKGQPDQVVRHSPAIIVGHARPDRNDLEGDELSDDKADYVTDRN